MEKFLIISSGTIYQMKTINKNNLIRAKDWNDYLIIDIEQSKFFNPNKNNWEDIEIVGE